MSNLESAIQLIRQGRKTEAQSILQSIIKNDPKNIQAWFWYVETCTTVEQRIQALEVCLRLNPDNPQVMQALQRFQGRQPSAPAPTQPEPSQAPLYEYQEEDPEPQPSDNSYGYDSFRSPSFEPIQSPSSLFDESEEPTNDPYGSFQSAYPVENTPPQKQPWEMQPSEYVDNSMLAKPKRSVKTYSAFDVWMTALTSSDEKSYADLLNDPEMGLDRAFMWIAIAGLISAFAVPIQLLINSDLSKLMTEMPELRNIFGSSLTSTSLLILVTVFSVIVTPLGSIISLAFTGGIQHLLSRLFGGGGTYTRTVYAMAAFLAPITIILALVSIVPYAGGCLSLPLSIYNLVLNVRALKAAQYLTNGAAIGVVLAPTFLALLFVCLFVFMSVTSLPSS